MSATVLIVSVIGLLSAYVCYGIQDGMVRRWRQWRHQQRLNLQVIRLSRQQDMLKIWIADPHGRRLPKVVAGQHVLLCGQDLLGRSVSRAYSLVQDATHRHFYLLAIKAEPKGRLSQALFQRLRVGDTLQLSYPKGQFKLQGGWRHHPFVMTCLQPFGLACVPLVLVGAGIGITPMLAMMMTALRQGRRVTLWYQARTEHDLLFHRYLQRLPNLDYRPILSRGQHGWQGAQGRLTATTLLSVSGVNAEYYICAKAEMVETLERDLRLAGVQHCYHELFSAAHSKDNFGIQFADQQAQSFGHSSVLDALLAAGVQVPYDCRGGSCGQCRLKIVSGQCRTVLAAEYPLAAGEILTCCVQASSPLELARPTEPSAHEQLPELIQSQ